MKWTKQLAVKINKICGPFNMEMIIDTNVGHCDFYFGKNYYNKIASIRWYGDMMDVSNQSRNEIHVATCWVTKVFKKYTQYTHVRLYDDTIVWDSHITERQLSGYRFIPEESEHVDLLNNEITEEKLLDFLKENFYKCLEANRFKQLSEKLDRMKEDFK